MKPEDRLRQIHRLFVQLASTKGAEYDRAWDQFAQVIQDIPQSLSEQQGVVVARSYCSEHGVDWNDRCGVCSEARASANQS